MRPAAPVESPGLAPPSPAVRPREPEAEPRRRRGGFARGLRRAWRGFRSRTGKPSPRRVKTNVVLRFCCEVLGLDHLHYGLWEGDPLTLAGLRSAQQRFSDRLLEWIPEGVGSVLDVGCGTGATAAELLAKGYEVEGLSPDPYQGRCFAERVGAPFHLVRFQELEPERRWDLVLMSESAQYIWLERLFPSVVRAAEPGGWLLVADYFTLPGAEGPMAESGHRLDRFLAAARDAGAVLEHREDITGAVLPTLDLMSLWGERYALPSLLLAADWLAGRSPRLARWARAWAERKVGSVGELRRLVDREEFRRTKRYEVMLFRLSGRVLPSSR